MGTGVEKVDSAAGRGQHTAVARLRQLRAPVHLLLVAGFAAAPLAAQQEQRVVRGLSFEGNHAIDDYTLSTAIATSNSSYFASTWWLRWTHLGEKRFFNELEFRRDVVRLLLLYRRSGYVNAVIDTLVRRADHDVFITFRISEGEPVRLARFDVLGLDAILNVPALKQDLPLQVGQPFNRLLFQASADSIVSRLRNRGYPYAEVLRNFDMDASALRAEATLDVVPGPRMRLGDVAILGLEQIDTATVRRMLSVKPYELYRQDRLYQSQRDLYGMGVFRSVNVALVDTVPPPPGDTTVRVVVRLTEGPRHRVLVGAGYGTIDCFRVQGGWTAYDFLGGARALDLTARLSKLGVGHPTDAGFRKNLCPRLNDDPTSDTVNYTVGLTLRQPAFLSPRHTANLGVFAERRSEFLVYTRQAVGLNVGVTINARRNVPVTIGYGYSVGRTTADPASYCSVFRLCDSASQAFLRNRRRFAAVTVSGVRNQANSVLDPSDGSLVTAALMHSSRVVGSDTLYEFNRGEMEVSRYHPLGRRAVFAWRVRAGAIVPQRITLSGQSAQYVPPDQRFYAGGPNSVRGYARNELGPLVYVTSDTTAANIVVQGADTTYRDLRTAPTGGNSVFVLNAELRLPTPVLQDRLRLGLYVDVGQVWGRSAGVASPHGLRVTPGAGLRYATPLGPVRLDVAYNDYAQQPGPLYFQSNTPPALALYRPSFQPSRPASFWRRLVVQFAVGQAF